MKNKSKAYLSKIITENRILLVINFCVFCFICGYELKKYRSMNFSVWEYIIIVLANHYYVLYCMLPIFLILIAKYIKSNRDIEIIRYKNFFYHIRQSTRHFSNWIFIYLISHLVTVSAIGITKLGVSFERKIGHITAYDEMALLLDKYMGFFGNALIAIVSIMVYMLFGLVSLISLLSYINHRYGYKCMILISILIYILTFIGFKTEIKTHFPIICFNNYILLHHGLFVNYGIKFVFIVLSGLFIIFFCLRDRNKSKGFGFGEFVLTRKEILVSSMISIVIILLEIIRSSMMRGAGFKNVMVNVFAGTGIQSSYFFSWLGITIIYMTPLFFVGISISRLEKYAQLPLVIRFNNALHFMFEMEKRYLKYICLYALMIVIIGNVLLWSQLGTVGEIDILYEMFGTELSIKMQNIFFLICIVYLLFDYVLFRILNRYMGGVASLILILLCKFICFLLPDLNLLYLNFGIIRLYENKGDNGGLIFRIVSAVMMILLYFISIFVRRRRYADN